jgi:hypothetical protein
LDYDIAEGGQWLKSLISVSDLLGQ